MAGGSTATTVRPCVFLEECKGNNKERKTVGRLDEDIQGLPNLIGRWLPTGQPSITIWLPNNDWWLPNSARHKMLTFGG